MGKAWSKVFGRHADGTVDDAGVQNRGSPGGRNSRFAIMKSMEKDAAVPTEFTDQVQQVHESSELIDVVSPTGEVRSGDVAPDPGDPSTDTLGQAMAEVIRVAMPLMISTGTFSVVLFADRTFLLWYDGAAMSASMAAGNLFWTLICVPVGVSGMTGAVVSQYVGSRQREMIGRFLWQVVWFALATLPLFGLIGTLAPTLFSLTGQPAGLIELESAYLRLLMWGAGGIVLESGLSGFFAGTERTHVIMWASIASGVVNLVLDWMFIFGMNMGPLQIEAMGIIGAGWASLISFWFKGGLFAFLLARPKFQESYRILAGISFDPALIRKLLFFGLPSGLMSLTEAAGFTAIVLQIGQLGDLPLRATTMAINFNMIAYVPLVGVAIAASVLVGRHLTESGPSRAVKSVAGALSIGWIYSMVWAVLYLAFPDQLLALYQWGDASEDSMVAISLARNLLGFVAIYVIVDATQLIVAGSLRGAGDTWFVLLSGLFASIIACSIGIVFEPETGRLTWWWWVVTGWVFLLAASMVGRFLQGRWKSMRMV